MSYRRSMASLATSLVVFAYPAHADNSIESAKCKATIASIVRLTNAKIDHASPSGDNMFFSHPGIGEFVLFCGAATPIGVSASVETAYPSQAYFTLLGNAGSAIVEANPKQVEAAAVACQSSALQSEDETSQKAIANGTIECQAFTRDGGGTTIGINAR